MSRPSYTLKTSCNDAVGIVAAVTGFLAKRGSLLTEVSHFVDDESQKSFIRVVFEDDAQDEIDLSEMIVSYRDSVAHQFDMSFEFHPADRKVRVMVAVSKQSHCLNALLHRWADGHLPIEITGVVSNHDDQRSLVEWHKLPYHHLPIETGRKPEQEAKILTLFADTDSELMVLARYMQILTPHACDLLAGRAINIHHSFFTRFQWRPSVSSGL